MTYMDRKRSSVKTLTNGFSKIKKEEADSTEPKISVCFDWSVIGQLIEWKFSYGRKPHAAWRICIDTNVRGTLKRGAHITQCVGDNNCHGQSIVIARVYIIYTHRLPIQFDTRNFHFRWKLRIQWDSINIVREARLLCEVIVFFFFSSPRRWTSRAHVKKVYARITLYLECITTHISCIACLMLSAADTAS